MERQALRDAVLRYNAEGLAGLHDRSRGRPRRRLDASEEAALVAAIERGPKGRLCHRWWRRGERPPGVQQIGYLWTYIFTAIRPATGEDFTLVLPSADTAAMQVFLNHVAGSRPADAHLVMVLDGADWHVSRDIVVPPSITLVVRRPCLFAICDSVRGGRGPDPPLGDRSRTVARGSSAVCART
jgi:hypothetical protein